MPKLMSFILLKVAIVKVIIVLLLDKHLLTVKDSKQYGNINGGCF